MTKVERIKALVATTGYTEADAKWLEAVPDERLTTLEAQAIDAAKIAADLKTAQDAAAAAVVANSALEVRLKAAEASIIAPDELTRLRALAAAKQAQDDTRHGELVAQLKTAQSVFTEDQLKASSLETLETYAKLAKVEAPNHSGRIVPVTPLTTETYVPADPYAAGIKALQEQTH